MPFLKRYAFWLASIFMLILTFLFFSTSQSIKQELSIAEKIIYITSKPVELFFYYGKNWISSTYHNYIDLKNAKIEEEQLKKENNELKMRLILFVDVAHENNRLRKLLSLQERSLAKFLSCEMSQQDPSFLYKNIRINCGQNNGVEHGMGVVTGDGVVGVVMRVLQTSSDILLLPDPNRNLDVIVDRNRRRGVLQGGLSNIMQFKYFERGSDLLVGDEIITSGLTGAFPGGIPVGKVTNIKFTNDNVTEMIAVEPTVNFSELTEVLVLLTPNREVDIIRKVGGIDWIKKLVESNAGKNGS